MLIDSNLKNLCKAILDGDVNDDNFSNLVVRAKIKLDGPEWDVPNKLLEKSEELSLLVGGRNNRTVH